MTRTASDVRSMFQSNPARMARLSLAAQRTVVPGARGKIHPDAIREDSRGRKAEHRYVPGATKAVTTAAKADAAAVRAAAAKAGHTAKVGPIPKAVLASLSKG